MVRVWVTGKLCDPLVTRGSYLSALDIRSFYINEPFRRSTSDIFGKVTPVDDAHMYWTHGCGWGLWGSGQKESRGLAD